MTPEQRYDRWERIARLLYKAAMQANRDRRKQTEKLKALIDARKKYDEAKLAAEKDDRIDPTSAG